MLLQQWNHSSGNTNLHYNHKPTYVGTNTLTLIWRPENRITNMYYNKEFINSKILKQTLSPKLHNTCLCMLLIWTGDAFYSNANEIKMNIHTDIQIKKSIHRRVTWLNYICIDLSRLSVNLWLTDINQQNLKTHRCRNPNLPDLVELGCSGEPGWATAHDCNRFARPVGWWIRFHPSIGPGGIDDGVLDVLNCDGRVTNSQHTWPLSHKGHRSVLLVSSLNSRLLPLFCFNK